MQYLSWTLLNLIPRKDLSTLQMAMDFQNLPSSSTGSFLGFLLHCFHIKFEFTLLRIITYIHPYCSIKFRHPFLFCYKSNPIRLRSEIIFMNSFIGIVSQCVGTSLEVICWRNTVTSKSVGRGSRWRLTNPYSVFIHLFLLFFFTFYLVFRHVNISRTYLSDMVGWLVCFRDWGFWDCPLRIFWTLWPNHLFKVKENTIRVRPMAIGGLGFWVGFAGKL